MKNMINKKVTIAKIKNTYIKGEEYSIYTNGFIWSPKDMQFHLMPQPKGEISQPKGGTFNIDNLVNK